MPFRPDSLLESWHHQNMAGCRIPELATREGLTPDAMERALHNYRRKHGLAAPGHKPKRLEPAARSEPAFTVIERDGVRVKVYDPGFCEGYGWDDPLADN